MRRNNLILLLVVLLAISVTAQIVQRGSHPKHIALTFDDGPNPGVTDKILKILKAENIKATFFVIGQKAEKNPDLLKQIAEDGHEIGNHTYHHSRMDWINEKKLLNELKKTSDLIMQITGKKDKYFRPPHGRLVQAKRKAAENAGYRVVLWSVNADDFWHHKRGMRMPHLIARRVLSQARGRDIILMHDNSQQIVEALPKIIRPLKKRGYYFVTLSKMLSKSR